MWVFTDLGFYDIQKQGAKTLVQTLDAQTFANFQDEIEMVTGQSVERALPATPYRYAALADPVDVAAWLEHEAASHLSSEPPSPALLRLALAATRPAEAS